MNLRLTLSRLCIPGYLKTRQLDELWKRTARALGTEPPCLGKMPFGRRLEAYALFSRAAAEEVLKREQDVARIRQALFREARSMGEQLRSEIGVENARDVRTALRVLYRVLRIDFRAAETGETVISRCFFSRFYSPPVCGLISALDEGVAAGLSGGGRLEFTQRMTEGHDCCRARFVASGEST